MDDITLKRLLLRMVHQDPNISLRNERYFELAIYSGKILNYFRMPENRENPTNAKIQKLWKLFVHWVGELKDYEPSSRETESWRTNFQNILNFLKVEMGEKSPLKFLDIIVSRNNFLNI